MRLLSLHPSRKRRLAALTLVEMMVATGIYLGLFIGAIVAVQIFALRVYTLAATKLTATEGSRRALSQMRDDIRQAKSVQVGVADFSGNFTPYGGTNLAVGNALKVFATTNVGVPYSLYFLRVTNSGGMSSNTLIYLSVTATSTVTTKLATYITNQDIFAAEDWNNWPGPVVTNKTPITNGIDNNQVYSIKMQFYQWEYPIAVISATNAANAYDYYQLRTRVCRRALD